ncbi:hypothetical protein FISHEDRAFT_39545 [Fistulina hepatica ATCC 64428]|uniref:RRM domain-containing protein n=1 Tax=Fistulina hepatica ATCC 64428 TaxID=1128425 RepID=A0A0D7AIY9_9AGAR|nr:hypothetical protein FISHEDRAFT_39545 [Fistulina hepatica ATCC 64428]
MTSLLERMNISPSTSSIGPTRTKSHNRSAPYKRSEHTPKGDVNGTWDHDLFDRHNSLSARLGQEPAAPKPSFTNIAQKALREASMSQTQPLSIKGASQQIAANIVEISGLVAGTTASDVREIFKRSGEITKCEVASRRGEPLRIRVMFKQSSSAQNAVKTFHGQPADGETLNVVLVGITSQGQKLAGRLSGKDGLAIVKQEGSVDTLFESEESNGKMRSDALLQSGRAHVLTMPPGANPADYGQGRPNPRRGGAGRGRGGRRGGKRGGGNNGVALMDVD